MDPQFRLKTRFRIGAWLAIGSLFAGIFTPNPGLATPPAWWLDGNPPILTGGVENNLGPATIGQAKWVVSEALRALEVEDADAEAAIRQLLTQPQPNPENPGQSLPAIVDLTVPADPKPQGWAEKQRAPLLVGQLKALSAPFYDVLHGLYPDWLNGQLIAAQTKDAADPDNFYPWTSEAADDQNSAIATIGQLKAVFALHFDKIDGFQIDSDGDGLPDVWELAHGTNPDVADSSHVFQGGQITNLQAYQAGVQAHPNATLANFDGDGSPNEIDADPRNGEVDWEAVERATYAFIEIDVPSTAGAVRDLNDKGEVLYDNGIWSGGDWIPKEANEIAGSYPVVGAGEEQTYETAFTGWHSFNRDGSLLGWAHVEFTNGQAAGGDGMNSIGSWITGQSTRHLPDQIPFHAFPGSNYSPIGIDESGRTFARMGYYTGDPSVEVMKIAVFDAAGSFLSSVAGPGGFHPIGSGGHSDVSESGWVASNTTDSLTNPTSHRLGVWNAQLGLVNVSAEGNQWFFPLHLADLPNGKIILVAGTGGGFSSQVFVQDGQGGMKHSASLSAEKIRLFAGDGTAITSDGKLWSNGVSVPLEDICDGYAERKAQGWSFWPYRANLGGAFLIQATKPSGEQVAVVMPKVEIKLAGTKTDADDLIAVSNGTDDDLATDFSFKVKGIDGLSAKLGVKGADGDVKYKVDTMAAPAGTEVGTKVWGVTPSSAKEASRLLITLKKGTKNLGSVEKKATVFKGALIQFGGNFYINVDTREFARRPWDGRADPKPNSKADMTGNTQVMDVHIGTSPTPAAKAAYKLAVDQCLAFGYESAVSFEEGDNLLIPSYKPWKDDLEVKVIKIASKNPVFDITVDPLIGSKILMKNGYLHGFDGAEELRDPEICAGEFFSLNDPAAVTGIVKEMDSPAPAVTEAQIAAQIAAARGVGHDQLLDVLDQMKADLARFSNYRFSWENDTFDVKKDIKLKNSAASKAVKGERAGGGKVEIRWIFADWNEFKFQGSLKDGVIETK
jgi:hypothetical protein